MRAYKQATLEGETIKLTVLPYVEKPSFFTREVYDLEGQLNFFTQRLSTFSDNLVNHGFSLSFFDHILFL